MSKMELVRAEMVKAMKSGDKERKECLSLLLAALKAKFIDKRAELSEEEENTIILKEIKQTKETLTSTPSDRTELIDECNFRITVLSEFAPVSMDEAEIKGIIQKVIADLGISAPTVREKGAIMKNLMPLVKGKADGALVNKLVGELFE
ncbi:GatB/YqeY domain-containing protein [Oscillospiraceae bacterium PP1C4]